MAAAATVVISGNFSALPGGSSRQIGPVVQTSAAACGQVTEVVLQAGANTITIPTVPAPSGCVITLPVGNTSITTLKGVTGDTGIALGKTTSQLLSWDPTAVPASFVLTSVSTQTGLITEITFF